MKRRSFFGAIAAGLAGAVTTAINGNASPKKPKWYPHHTELNPCFVKRIQVVTDIYLDKDNSTICATTKDVFILEDLSVLSLDDIENKLLGALAEPPYYTNPDGIMCKS